MREADIIETLQAKLSVPVGRHLYGILGTYAALDRFAAKLHQVRMPNGEFFPGAVSVNRGILNSIPDTEFKSLAENEPRRPEPTMARVAQAFAAFLRSEMNKKDLIVLAGLELIFIYNVELNLLRTMATDHKKVILLLPGKRERGEILMYLDSSPGEYKLPSNLIADNHLWEVTN